MLSPEYLQGCTDSIVSLYQQLEDATINDIVRRLVNTNFQMTQSAVFQNEKLQQAGMVFDDIIKQVGAITGKSDAELKTLFLDAGTETLAFDDSVYKSAGLKPLPIKQSPQMLGMLTAGIKKCGKEMKNLTKTTANTAQTAYLNACDMAYMQISSGAFDYNTAVRLAIERVGGDGSYVLYPSGHRDRIDVAIRRSALTGVNQTCGELQTMRMDEMDCELVETTAHAGARFEHALWQGRVFSYNGRNKKYPDFRSSTGYGTVTGLMGANCRHGFFPFYAGISDRAYTQRELDQMESHTVEYNGKKIKDYDASQIQRKMERDIRDTKRTLTGIDTAVKETNDGALKRGLQDDFAIHSAKLKMKETKLSDFLKQTEREDERARVQVSGFGKSQAQKAMYANKRLQFGGENGIINKKGGGRMDIEIDKFSPCLIERKTGKIINTSYGIASPTELKTLKKSGWLFNWQGDDLKEAKIFKLTVENSKEIQGLVAITDYPKDSAFYVNLAESAPHNRGVSKEYEGVGGHLFAIAASESVKCGYDGYLFLDAKNMELVDHYAETLGAKLLGMPHPYRMVVDELAANKLLKTYTLKEV